MLESSHAIWTSRSGRGRPTMKRFLMCATAGGLLLSLACGSRAPVAPSSTAAAPSRTVGDVSGQVVERYGGAPVPNAVVSAAGDRVSEYVVTDADGHFVLHGLGTAGFTVYVVADGFTVSSVAVSGPDLGRIELQPMYSAYEWTGTFPEPSTTNSRDERLVPFETTHRGPVTFSFHAECATQATYGPLYGFLYRAGETDLSRYLAGLEFGSYSARDGAVETVVPPGAYYARLAFDNNSRNGCAWAIRLRYPM